MPAVTVKNLPSELLERLRQRALRDRRSLNQEILYLLEGSLADETTAHRQSAVQADAWTALAGRWQSDRTAEEERQEIFPRRTAGREVDL
jgi:plasmid stability protein